MLRRPAGASYRKECRQDRVLAKNASIESESCDTLNWVKNSEPEKKALVAKGQRSHFANFQSATAFQQHYNVMCRAIKTSPSTIEFFVTICMDDKQFLFVKPDQSYCHFLSLLFLKIRIIDSMRKNMLMCSTVSHWTIGDFGPVCCVRKKEPNNARQDISIIFLPGNIDKFVTGKVGWSCHNQGLFMLKLPLFVVYLFLNFLELKIHFHPKWTIDNGS